MDIPQRKQPQKEKAQENHRAEQLGEEEAQSNNGERVGKVTGKEKRKEV